MKIVEDDYKDLMDMVLNNYEELNKIPNITKRLDFYSIIELLENYKNTKNIDRLESVKEIVKRLK